jgi:hypothetical protein
VIIARKQAWSMYKVGRERLRSSMREKGVQEIRVKTVLRIIVSNIKKSLKIKSNSAGR